MVKEIKTQHEIITYEYNNKEREDIINRVLKSVGEIGFYWDYNDELSEEQILKIFDEDGLADVENDIYDNSMEYMDEEIYKIMDNELNEKEQTDEELKESLREKLQENYNLNIKDLLKNSSVRLRCELETNEEFMVMDDYKKTEYYKLIKKVFKDVFKVKDLNEEINSFCGSGYSKLVFFFKVSGENILKLRDELQSNKITFNKVGCGFFNNWMGCGGMLDLEMLKPITLNINNWTNNKDNDKYYNISVKLDKQKYGINEVYGLVGDCWREY